MVIKIKSFHWVYNAISENSRWIKSILISFNFFIAKKFYTFESRSCFSLQLSLISLGCVMYLKHCHELYPNFQHQFPSRSFQFEDFQSSFNRAFIDFFYCFKFRKLISFKIPLALGWVLYMGFWSKVWMHGMRLHTESIRTNTKLHTR